jgi:hypothetical protein
MTREEWIAFLKGEAAKGSIEQAQLVADIREHAMPVHQIIFKAGETKGEKTGDDKLTDMTRLRDTAVTERDAFERENTTLKNKNTDVSNLARDHDQKMLAKETAHKAEIAKKDDAIRNLRIDNGRAEWLDIATNPDLTKGAGLNRVYAENVYHQLVRDGRVKWDNEGRRTVYGPDKATPISGIGAEETDWHPLGREIRKTAPDIMIEVKGETGTGVEKKAAGGGGGGSSSKFDQIRAEEESRVKTQQATAGKSAEERMGVRK